MAMRDEKATASYNFVPLPATVIRSPIDGGAKNDAERQENYKRYVKEHGRLSGQIELSCRTMTPVFIGTGDKEGAFFAPAGKPILPGSTLRGMVKNIFKIVTCGAMRMMKSDVVGGQRQDFDVDNRRLYFRTVAAKKNSLTKLYDEELLERTDTDEDGERISITKAEAAFLVHDSQDGNHYMCRAEYRHKKVEDKGFLKHNAGKILWETYERTGELPCFTGAMFSKKRYTVHFNPDWNDRVLVTPEVIAQYKEDLLRSDVLDLFKLARKNEEARNFTGDDRYDFVVPCFYKNENGTVKHFGFGQFYRICYPYRLGEAGHIPEILQSKAVDYADALFGRTELWGSRLFFEDAVLKESKGFEGQHYSKTLGEPKPTSFQLYMEQEDGKNLNHWDTENAAIRGYKLYWHQKPGFRWQKNGVVKENVDRKLRPLKAGNVFEGRIRFKNLSEVELGALLKVFSLAAKDRELCFKIGQGKGIGLGSVRIDAKLVLVDEVHGYEQLFAADGDWNKAEKETSMEAYLKAFDDVIAQLGETERARYELSQQALLDLLDWKAVEQKDWAARTRQMTLGDRDSSDRDEVSDAEKKQFRNRWVLPTAHEVYDEGIGK